MFKKIILVSMGFVFLGSYNLVFGAPIINEFMYDLDGSDIDWVEIYNASGDIDVTTLKLLISNSTSNHAISAYSGSETLHGGDYGIIVPSSQISAFVAKYGNSGNIFTSSFSLPNTAGKIEINDGDKASPISSVDYDSSVGGAGDGKSLQLISGSWTASSPTLGKLNQASSSDDNADDDTNDDTDTDNFETTTTSSSSSSSTSKTSATPKKVTTSKIKAEIISQSLAYVGIPIVFQGKAFGSDGKQSYHGRYFWNFGDGDSRETQIINTDKFTHTYFYAGEYTVLFEYYPDSFADVPDATDKIVIKVVAPGVSISSVGNEKDFFVELSNANDYDVDVSKWILMSDYRSFKIPQNTILKSKKKMIISPRLTNMNVVDKNSLKLMNSEGGLVFDYHASLNPISSPQKTTGNNTARIFSASSGIENDIPLEPSAEEENSADNLSASALSSVPYFPAIASVALVGASVGAVYLIRKRKSNSGNRDDFEMLKD